MIRTVTAPGIQIRYLWVMLVALIVADGVITNFLVQYGLAFESNPLLQEIAGGPALTWVKIAGSGIIVLALHRIRTKDPLKAARASVLGVIAYTGIVYWNLLAFAVAQLSL